MKLRPYRNGPLLPTAFCLLLTALLALPGPAAGQAPTERILSFHSDIVVHEDASMSVTETITVRATGAQIRRGIFRDFPTRYTDALRNNYVVDFQVLDVLRDGRAEPYRVEGVANGKRVYVGREDVFLESGRYTYTLTYRTDRQLGFFEAHDELYWNVTGNGWVFPIDRASARVVLPANIPRDQLRLDAYTGAQGGRDQDYEVTRDLAGEPTFSTTKPLDKFEGLTLVVGWPKGYVQEPMAARRLEYFVRDNPAAVVGVPGLLLVLVYFLWRWSQVGKDPARGAIIPLYSPPDGFSPAAVRYIRRMGFDQQTFTASVLNMAVGGFVKLSQRAKTYTLQRDSGDISGLEPEETAAAEKLLGDGDRLSLSRSNYRKVQEALEATKKSLDQRFGRGYFDKNHDDFLVGLGLSILVALIVLVLSGTVGTLFFLPLLLIPVGIAVFGWRMAATERNRIVGAGKALFLTLFALPFVGVGAGSLVALAPGGTPIALAICAVLGALNALFFELLKTPTYTGRALLDKIEGFKMFLTVTEADRMRLLNPPDRTPQLFEKYLPYAVALDVEHEWADQFSNVLAQAAQGAGEYQPTWYAGSAWRNAGPTGFASSLGSSLTTAIAASSTPPGSSSGSSWSSSGSGGGGGSSGGGGGGGGW